MKVLLFGTGDCYQKYKKWFEEAEIVGLLDNDECKTGTQIDGFTVMRPQEGIKKDYECIYILSVHEKEMRCQLMELGVSKDKIYHYHDIRLHLKKKKKEKVKYYGNMSRSGSILFLSYDFNFNGASFALYHAILVMVRRGYRMSAASMNDGEMRNKILELGVPVIIDPDLQMATFVETDWAQPFQIIFCNTLNFYYLLSERNLEKQFVWWLHEPEYFYNGINNSLMRRINDKNLHVYAAGPPAEEAYRRLGPGNSAKTLLYGLEDQCKNSNRTDSKSRKMRFTLIGNMQRYKAQDLFVDAIQMLDETVRDQAEYYFAGICTGSGYASMIQEKTEAMSGITFTGPLDQEDIHEVLNGTDILVCPSRQDTMPTVAAEAMMHAIPCILSDKTGTASLVENGRSGFIFESENIVQLSEILRQCIEGRYDLEAIGANARIVYEENFSLKVFEENIIHMFQMLT